MCCSTECPRKDVLPVEIIETRRILFHETDVVASVPRSELPNLVLFLLLA